MKNNIIVDITDVVERQKQSQSYNIRLATLIVAILVLCALTIAKLYNLPMEYFAIAAIIVIILATVLYYLPDMRDKKFLKPYVDNMLGQLHEGGYDFKDKTKFKNLTPWFSGKSNYLYGKGLTVVKNPAKGVQARKLSFLNQDNETVPLSVERLSTSGKILLQVVMLDENGSPVLFRPGNHSANKPEQTPALASHEGDSILPLSPNGDHQASQAAPRPTLPPVILPPTLPKNKG